MGAKGHGSPNCTRHNSIEDDVLQQGKAFEIPKVLVWQSYQDVRRNKGAPGWDGQTIKQFDEKRDRNLYKIWNRLSSGSYFPPPVLEKSIPKEDGSERVLGIPTVSDRIAQGAVKRFLEARLDGLFHPDSYGYRPGRSAHQALTQCEKRCRTRGWVLEVDIEAFFDHVNHDLIIKALKHHQMPDWIILYCTRWLKDAKLRGWINYYGKFWYRTFSYRVWSVFQSRLIKWASNKYRISTREAERRLEKLRKIRPNLFAHWELLRASNV